MAESIKIFPRVEQRLFDEHDVFKPQDYLRFLAQCQRLYGDYVKVDGAANLDFFLLSHPAAVEHVLRKNQDAYTKAERFMTSMTPVVGEGLLTSSGADWLKQRKFSQPAFSHEQLPKMLAVVSGCLDSLLMSWREIDSDSIVDLHDEFVHLTNAISLELMLGERQDARTAALKPAFMDCLYQLNGPVFRSNTTSDARASVSFLLEAAKKLDQLTREAIEARRADKGKMGSDLLSHYMAAEAFTEQDLVDEIKTLLVIGYQNLATCLTWTIYMLMSHADIRARVAAEAAGIICAGKQLSIEDLYAAQVTRSVIQETVRLYPPSWGLSRVAKERDSIEGYEIPKGSAVVLCQWITHRHKDFWPDAENFKPERFASPQSAANYKSAYFPFGFGTRQCIAQDLSLSAAIIIVGRLVQLYEFSIPSGWVVEEFPTSTLLPKGGLPVTMRRL